jgi:hypothetical protein
MTIATYSDLKSSVASWLHRSDLTTQIPDFIALCEASLNRKLRLRTMETTSTLTLTISNRTVSLPSGFLEPLSLEIVESGDGNESLTNYLRQPQQLRIDASSSARPLYWAIRGANIEFENIADKTYSLSFGMVEAFALSDASPTNWLLTNQPDLYLYGTLLQAAPYLRDDARIQIWGQFYEKALIEVRNQAARTKSKILLVTDLPVTRTRENIMTGGY